MAKKNLKKGVLITFEGPEGSGKSTHTRLLCDHLRKQGFSIVHLREPGATKIGEKIRKLLLDPKNKNMNNVCEMLLYQAARAQLVDEKLISALALKKVVLLDRFLDATICYQGYAAGIDINEIKKIGKLATFGVSPDLTILLDIDAKTGLAKSGRGDRMEKKSLSFHRKVRKGYLQLAKANPLRIKMVPVAKEITQTQNAIRKIVEKKLCRLMR